MDDPETPDRDAVLLSGTPDADRQWTAVCQRWRCAQCGAVIDADDPTALRAAARQHIAREHPKRRRR